MCAAVDDLQKQLAHGGVDCVADKVAVKRFEDGLARQDFRRHGRGVCHAAASDGLNQRFLNNALFHVEREFAGALLGSAPANAVR
ncbi:hypothetical protein SDC9_141304 [bioreactor metagenome]|uniref:Uncharacterized protein n=1 Tax=bioreactor metagenome TaxID=1076179 RepID=A0A645DY12_9ZZZZ